MENSLFFLKSKYELKKALKCNNTFKYFTICTKILVMKMLNILNQIDLIIYINLEFVDILDPIWKPYTVIPPRIFPVTLIISNLPFTI